MCLCCYNRTHWSDGCVHQSTFLSWTHGLARTNIEVMAVYIRAHSWAEHTVCPGQTLKWWLCTSEHIPELNTRSVQNKYWSDSCVHQSTFLSWTHGLSRTNIEVIAVYIRAHSWAEHKVCPEQILKWWLCTSKHIPELNTRSTQDKHWSDGCVHQSTFLSWTYGLPRTNIEVMAVYIRVHSWAEHTVCPEQILKWWLCTSEHIPELNTRSVQDKCSVFMQ